jgi:protein-tyrosine sulfotransferase
MINAETDQQNINTILAKWRNEDWTELDAVNTSDYVSESTLAAIGGCARSGTTLLRAMLDSHTKITSGPPSSIFIPTPLNASQLAHLYDLPEKEVLEAFNRSPDRARFIDEFRVLCLDNTGKSLWIDKTARNVHRFSWINRHFPNAKVIHMIRDGRDVVCSLRSHRKRRVTDGKLELTGYRMPLENAALRWVQDVSVGLQLRGNRNYVEVRYEQLVLDTENTLRDLCVELGVDFEPEMLRFHELKGPLRDPLKFPQNLEATMPLYPTAIGRWKTDLDGEDLNGVMEVIAPTLALLGYD